VQRTGRQAPGRYILPCFFGGAVRAYHRALVEEIAARFDLPFTLRQDIPAHFTVKYHFETADIAPMEALLDAFAHAQHPAPVEVGGFGHFDEDVAWVNVALSAAARATLASLHDALRGLPWLSWGPHDGEHLRPHMTVAEGCRSRFADLWAYLPARERHFEAAFDNVTLLRQVGEEDGITRWAVARAFPFGGGPFRSGAGAASPRP
jgi:2'-5' RNA ligase